MNVHDVHHADQTRTGAQRYGLLLLGLLSLGDVAAIFVTDGKTPPYAVAALSTVLGLACLFLAVRALRQPWRPIRLLVGLRILSAVTALPAFVVDDVPAAAKVAAAAVVVITAVAILLTGRTRQSMATA